MLKIGQPAQARAVRCSHIGLVERSILSVRAALLALVEKKQGAETSHDSLVIGSVQLENSDGPLLGWGAEKEEEGLFRVPCRGCVLTPVS